ATAAQRHAANPTRHHQTTGVYNVVIHPVASMALIIYVSQGKLRRCKRKSTLSIGFESHRTRELSRVRSRSGALFGLLGDDPRGCRTLHHARPAVPTGEVGGEQHGVARRLGMNVAGHLSTLVER